MNQRMDVRTLPDRKSTASMNTQELRGAFVAGELFAPGEVRMVYCDADRAIIGGAVPGGSPLPLEATRKEMAAEYFTERREIGIVNIGGGTGTVRAGGTDFAVRPKDMLYIGRGTRSIEFAGAPASGRPVFYFVSFPAHAEYPAALMRYEDAEKSAIGSPGGASRRTIHRFIHPNGIRSCQLVMGLTELEAGSVWNTMPPHTHQRRMEVYLYYAMEPGSVVVHLMGEPVETRSLILRDREAVISPAWSIHCGAATSRYSFIWAMGGENQEFGDMDGVKLEDLR